MNEFWEKAFIAALVLGFSALPALAQDKAADVQAQRLVQAMPLYRLPLQAADARSILHFSSLKPRILHLGREAGDVAVDYNQASLYVAPYKRDALVVWPRKPGAAHFTVRGKKGEKLLEQGVVAADGRQKYIRIAMCDGAGKCQEPRVYYCLSFCQPAHIEQMAGK